MYIIQRITRNKGLLKFLIILLLSVIAFFAHDCNFRWAKKGGDDLVSGVVTRVLDGDTYDLLLEDNTTVRIRMDAIDAPEGWQAYGREATNYLKEMAENQTVRVSLANTDRYNRVLSFSWLKDGRELSREMIKAGYAWHYKQYNNDAELARLEDEARAARRGLWSDDDPMAPWEARRLRRQGLPTR